jgi:putative transposase
MPKVYVIHENSVWVEPLRAAFGELGTPFEEWFLDQGVLDLRSPPPEGVFYNRMSASWHRQINQGVTGLRHRSGMKPPCNPRYARHRFPAEVISHAVWLYFRFPLSLRMVEEMLAARGILVSHETVRQWAQKFGQSFANQIRRRLPTPGDKWHLDEVAISIAGRKYWLWRAVDQHGVVLDILVQSRRNATAAKRLLRKLLKKQGIAPRVMITDKLASYGAANREIMLGVEHRQHKGLNNRAENSH